MTPIRVDDVAVHWSTPGTYEVADGVYRIPLPMPQDGLVAINVYALTTGKELVLIDGGWASPESRAQLDVSLNGLGYELNGIGKFLVTHMHKDHYTLAMQLRREVGAKVSLGAGERHGITYAQRLDGRLLRPQIESLRGFGAESLAAGDLELALAGGTDEIGNWDDPDTWLLNGEELAVGGRSLRVIDTPGHTRGHVVFHDAEAKLLFSGDHVLPRITPSIAFEPVPPPNPLGDFLRSLAVIAEQPDAMLLPAHGAVTGSTHQRVDELLSHHEARLDETHGCVSNGASTVYGVSTQLRWTNARRRFEELDVFNQMLALGETHWHLIMLMTQGRLAESVSGDLLTYRTTG